MLDKSLSDRSRSDLALDLWISHVLWGLMKWFLGLYATHRHAAVFELHQTAKTRAVLFPLWKNRRATAVLQSAEGYAIRFSSHKTSPFGQAAIWFLQTCCVLKDLLQPPPTTCACLNLCVCFLFSLWLYVKGVCLRKAGAGSLSVFVFILRAAITSCSWGPCMGKWAEQRQEQDLIGSEACVYVCVLVCECVCTQYRCSHL